MTPPDQLPELEKRYDELNRAAITTRKAAEAKLLLLCIDPENAELKKEFADLSVYANQLNDDAAKLWFQIEAVKNQRAEVRNGRWGKLAAISAAGALVVDIWFRSRGH